MNRQTEDRLRAAFDAKAEQVTDERLDQLAAQRRQSLIADLDEADGADDFPVPGFTDREPVAAVTRLDVDHPAGSSRHARWFAPVLAAAAVIAVAVGVTAVSTSVNNGKRTPAPPATQVSTPAPSLTPTPSRTAPSPSPSGNAQPSATATSPVQAVLLGNGKQADRSEIPWSQVGPGWRLASIPEPGEAATPVVYLINPIGGRYLISDDLPAGNSLEAWSPDGKRALLVRNESNDHRSFTELELATGKLLHTFDGGLHSNFVSYTRPQGQGLLLRTELGTTFGLKRFGTDGRPQLNYPTTLPGLGPVSDFTALYSPDGGELLVGVKNGIAVLGNDGHLIRPLPAPAEQTWCRPIKWWDAATVLTRCQNEALSSQRQSAPTELFLQPVAGGSPTKLAGGSPAAPFGFQDAWKYSNGVLLHQASGCGPGELDVMHDGVISKLILPAGVQTPAPLLAVDGDVVTVQSEGSCRSASNSVISYNIVTGAEITLAKNVGALISYPTR
jgi:TolB protein